MGGLADKRIHRARGLRRSATKAEQALWRVLRGHRAAGRQFRRQYPVGPYIVDFCCLADRLVVEVDGGQHAWRAGEDGARTAWLEAHGYRVLRFWNNEVLENIEGVAEAIVAALERRNVGD